MPKIEFSPIQSWNSGKNWLKRLFLFKKILKRGHKFCVKPKPLIFILLQESGGQFQLFRRLQQKQMNTQIRVCSTWKTSPSEQELSGQPDIYQSFWVLHLRNYITFSKVVAPHKKKRNTQHERKPMKRSSKNWLQGMLSPEWVLWIS